MHLCMHVPTAALPHLKGVRVCTTFVSVCAATISLHHPLTADVYWRMQVLRESRFRSYYISNDLLLCMCVCLYMYVRVSWCLEGTVLSEQTRDKRTLTPAMEKRHFSMKTRQKCRVVGTTTGCVTTQDACIEEKQRVSKHLSRELTKANKPKTNIYVHIHTGKHFCMDNCMTSESESASH